MKGVWGEQNDGGAGVTDVGQGQGHEILEREEIEWKREKDVTITGWEQQEQQDIANQPMDTGKAELSNIWIFWTLKRNIYKKYMDTSTNCKFKKYFPSSIEWFKILVSQRSSQQALNPMIRVPKWPASRYKAGKLKYCIFPENKNLLLA